MAIHICMTYEIGKDTYERYGKVSSLKEQRYSSTTISGGGAFNQITSTVGHHQYQTVWLKAADGTESSHQLYNQNIEVLEGQDVALIINTKTHSYERFVNLSTGHNWGFRGKGPKTFFGKLFLRLKILAISLFLSLPIMNVVMAIASLGEQIANKAGYKLAIARRRFYATVVFCLVLTLYYPLLPIYYPRITGQPSPGPSTITLTLSSENRVRLSSLALSGASVLNIELIKNDNPQLKAMEKLTAQEIVAKYRVEPLRKDFNFNKPDEDDVMDWVMLLSIPVWLMIYVYLMCGAKAAHRVAILLDQRCREMQEEYKGRVPVN